MPQDAAASAGAAVALEAGFVGLAQAVTVAVVREAAGGGGSGGGCGGEEGRARLAAAMRAAKAFRVGRRTGGLLAVVFRGTSTGSPNTTAYA